MEIKIIKNKGKIVKFGGSGVSVSMINALRRIVVSEIPTMAIEKVRFEENSSILNDEFLAHRLGLISLKTDLKKYTPKAECDCDFKGCAKCTAILTLDKKGPGTVYSKDLKSSDSKVIPAHDKIPLVKLTKSQRVKLEATAELGQGKDHIKWQSGLASYEIMDNKDFNFFVESYGQLSTQEMIKEAFQIFNKEISTLEKELK